MGNRHLNLKPTYFVVNCICLTPVMKNFKKNILLPNLKKKVAINKIK